MQFSKGSFDDEKGLYLVNFEETSSLIGYIKDEIFVIKSFEEFINDEIMIKLTEQVSAATSRYIVRVGLYKMAIEVSDAQIRHIVDL